MYPELIISKYGEPHRHYHNLTHLDYMFKTAKENRVEIKEGSALWYAILYHDIVYDPTRKDNEEKSAEMFRYYFWKSFKEEKDRLGFGVMLSPNNHLEYLTQYLIKLTKTHHLDRLFIDEDLVDAKNLIDLDLAILGDSNDVYQKYANAIREEYNFVDDKIFANKRIEWIDSMLARESIFLTEWGRKREEQARFNLNHEKDFWLEEGSIYGY